MSEDRIIGLLITAGFAVIGWFISRIFNEIERSRANERDLYGKIAAAETKQLQLHVELLKDALGQERNKK